MTKAVKYEAVGGLSVHPILRAFVDNEVLAGASIAPAAFWPGLAAIVADLAPRHHELLAVRNKLQTSIDTWHRDRKGQQHDAAAYEQFLRDIGYLVPAPTADAYAVATKNVDSEIATIAGPQLVVPLSNADSALNAVNARWRSLYDALYDTDIIPETESKENGDVFDPVRVKRVVANVRSLLDRIAPLVKGSHADAASYVVERGELEVTLADGLRTGLKSAGQFAGFTGPRHAPDSVLLVNNGLHIELIVDREHIVGKLDAAGVADVLVEAAVSVIMDLEDTAVAVDAEDKVAAYRTWKRLMDGSLVSSQASGTSADKLVGDRFFTAPRSGALTLHGRALMLVRNVGHHLFTDAVRDEAGNPVPEAILDAAITVACAVQDIRGKTAVRNSRTGSVYVIKPKMHGPDEVGLADLLFKRIEELLGLPKYTMKIGVMDEERRTSVNLAACLSRVRDRTFFLNTEFSDRVADEIHTSMEAGPVLRRAEMAGATWSSSYQANNVDVGIARNLPGRAQIGKGLRPAPSRMAAMVDEKIVHHLHAGASTTCVPNLNAATLLATHYHLADVVAAQDQLRGRPPASLSDLLSIPLATRSYTAAEVETELESNLQGLLGYVVRWVDHGAGVSSVPNRMAIDLMQDRAAVRMASQHVANWLHHGIVDQAQVRETMRRMAKLVDSQNTATENYRPLAPSFDGPAYKAAEDLIFKGLTQPNGYVETVLWANRLVAKGL